jgi:phage protein D
MNETLSYKVTIGGQDVTQQSPSGLEYMSVETHLDKVGVAELTFAAGGMGWDSFAIGDEATVKVGTGEKVFGGVITELRHSFRRGVQTFTVVVMDPSVKLASSRHVRVFEETSDSDVFSSVCGEAGVSTDVVDSTPEVPKYTFQRNESDLRFLRRLASRNGYLLYAVDGKVNFAKPQFSGSALEIDYGELITYECAVSTVAVPPSLTVYGWSYVEKRTVSYTASSGDLFKIGGGADGVSETGTVWQADSYVSDVQVATDGGAEAMAVGELNRLARGFVRGRATTQGRGDLYAGVKVKFTGFDGGGNAEGVVVSCRHVMDPRAGMTTEVHFVSNTKPE